jgi:hypothetical protein
VAVSARDRLPAFIRRRWKIVAVGVAIVLLPVLGTLVKLLILAIPLAFAVILPIGILQHLRQARSISDTPTSKICSAAQGYVELKGTSPTISDGPLSGAPACLWRLSAVRYRMNRRAGEKIEAELWAGAPSFFLPLDDGTGTCLVSLSEAELDGIETIRKRASRDDREALAPFFPVEERDELLCDGNWTLTETVLPANRPLYALGRFSSCTTTEEPRDLDWTEAVLKRGAKVPRVARMLARETAKVAQQYHQERAAEWSRLARRVEGVDERRPLRGTAQLSVLTVDYESQPPRPLLVSYRSESEVKLNRYLGLWPMVVGFFVGLGGTALTVWELFPETATTIAGWLGLASLLPR